MKKITMMSLSLLATHTLWADHPTLSFGSGTGAINTIGGDTMPAGTFAMGLKTESIINDAFSDETIESSVEAGIEDVHSVDSVRTESLSLAYGITDDLLLSINVPYITRNNIRAGEEEGGIPEVHHHGDAQGIGDISTLLQYKIVDKGTRKVSLLAGVKLPTGKTNIFDGDEQLESHLQPGSGSWDILAGVAFSQTFNEITLHGSMLYQYTTKGEQETELGDLFSYNVALSYSMIKPELSHLHTGKQHTDPWAFGVDVFTELNGESRAKDKIAGIEDENSGGDALFLSLGTRLTTNKGDSLFTLLSLPVYENYHGLQTENDYKVLVGVNLSF